MGAEPWSYFVPYREDIAGALADLREQEFAAGRYSNPYAPDSVPATIEEAFEQCEADGTQSILDMLGVLDEPRKPDDDDPNFLMVAPLAPDQLIELFGTERPSRAMVEAEHGLFELIERGQGIYLVVLDGEGPSEIFFAGYSID